MGKDLRGMRLTDACCGADVRVSEIRVLSVSVLVIFLTVSGETTAIRVIVMVLTSFSKEQLDVFSAARLGVGTDCSHVVAAIEVETY